MHKFTRWSLLIILSAAACARISVPPATISAVLAATPLVSTLNPHVEIFANTTTLNVGEVITVTGQAVDMEVAHFQSGFEDQGMTGDDDENEGLSYASQVLRLISVKDEHEQTILTLSGQSTGSTRVTISARGQSESLLITVLPPHPEIKWDTRPEKLVVQGTFCCGYVDWLVFQNYIPSVQIWGDGRMIWTEHNYTAGVNRRRVLEAHLTPEQMTQVFERAVNDGFFGWQDEYIKPNAYDYAYQCLSMELASVSKTVCEYVEGAPGAFHNLYNYLGSGMGLNGTDFLPTGAYVIAGWPNYSGAIPSHVDLQWPTDLGFSLSEATDGHWVEEEALAFVWQVVNENPLAVIQDGEDYYQIAVRVPGVSMEYLGQNVEPPPTEPSLRGKP